MYVLNQNMAILLLLFFCSSVFLEANNSYLKTGTQASLTINKLKSPDGYTFPDFNLNYLGKDTYQISYISNESSESIPHEVSLFLASIKTDQLFLLPNSLVEDGKKLHISMTESHFKRFGKMYGHPRDLWIQFPVGVKRLASGWIDYEVCDYNCTIVVNHETKRVTLTFIRLIKDVEDPKLDELNPKFRVNEIFLTSYVFEGVYIKD